MMYVILPSPAKPSLPLTVPMFAYQPDQLSHHRFAVLQVHKLCQEAAPRILEQFQPQLMIAIGGGGYVPARILRSFLKRGGDGGPNIPIQAIGLSLYETMGPGDGGNTTPGVVEIPGTKVTRTQWLDLTALGEMENLVGKRVLIVDEVDDTRTTLDYAVKELEKDVDIARQKMGRTDKTQFSIFVLHVSLPPWLRFLGQPAWVCWTASGPVCYTSTPCHRGRRDSTCPGTSLRIGTFFV
jgi:uncharacterized protein